MVIMNLKVNNLLAFKNFEINFSYPRKIINSSIENEHLEDRPNFRYKKVNILMGANASGKTSIGRVLMGIFNFIYAGNQSLLERLIENNKESSSFEIDFVKENIFNDNKITLFRVACNIVPNLDDKGNNLDYDVRIYSTPINKKDSYEQSVLKLKEHNIPNGNYISELKAIGTEMTWVFMLTEGNESKMTKEENFEIKILESVLKTLDKDILSVRKSTEVDNGYIIDKNNGMQIIIQEGEVIKDSKLSSGTISGIEIASLISIIKSEISRFYYCDEKFSFIHTQLEKIFLSVMIDCLHPNTQLFFTTHNQEILNMNLPKHSFTFLRKNPFIEAVYPSEYIKKEETSLYNAVENDVFSCSPNIDEILNLELKDG